MPLSHSPARTASVVLRTAGDDPTAVIVGLQRTIARLDSRRVALGATAGIVVRDVLGGAARLTAIGVAVGCGRSGGG